MHSTIPEDLLDGPRGRRLCLSVAESLDPGIRPLLAIFAPDPLDPEVARTLAAALAEFDFAPLAGGAPWAPSGMAG